MGKKLTTQDFINRAINVHGDRYDYSNTEYTNADTKVTIGCKIHGEFQQKAMDHMKGRGCSLCNERQHLTADQFINRACKIHTNKYTYENVVYTNVNTKVKIKCAEHGIFDQKPKDHMRGDGCPNCTRTAPVTTVGFIKRSKTAHGDVYDYSRVRLISMNKKVEIICPEHGSFVQRPADHVNGVGCPCCGMKKQGGYNESYFNAHPDAKNTPAFLYLISVNDSFCKIGITKKQYVKQRFPGMKFSVLNAKLLTLYDAFTKEQELLTKFNRHRYKLRDLEQLGYNGWTECFPLSLTEELKQAIEESVNA